MPDILICVPDSIRCCGECPCFYAEHPMRCQADTHRPKRTHGAPYAGKPDWCPAKELPPHGDLIDKFRIPYRDTYGGMIAEKDYIDRLPVIVPASEEVEP